MSSPDSDGETFSKLTCFSLDSIPRANRLALDAAPKERRAQIGRIISCAVLMLLVSTTSVFYGAASAAAWMRPASPVLGVILAIFSVGFFASSIYLFCLLNDLMAGLVPVSEQLRRLAMAEADLEKEILHLNEAATLWNEIAELFRDENGRQFTVSSLNRLRDEIAIQQDDVTKRIALLDAAVLGDVTADE